MDITILYQDPNYIAETITMWISKLLYSLSYDHKHFDRRLMDIIHKLLILPMNKFNPFCGENLSLTRMINMNGLLMMNCF